VAATVCVEFEQSHVQHPRNYSCVSFDETVIINQALYFGSHLEYALLNPNQLLRVDGLQVDYAPKQISQGEPSHPVYFPNQEQCIIYQYKHLNFQKKLMCI
jgi:hypothetical protein